MTATLLASLWAAPSVRGSEAAPRLPLDLQDPATGAPVRVEAGARALHLVLFATWCPPCRDELPHLAELDGRWAASGYRLVLIAVPTRQTAERLRLFLKQAEPPGTLLFDASGSVAERVGSDALPLHIVLDAHGKPVARATRLTVELEQAIEGLLREGGAGP